VKHALKTQEMADQEVLALMTPAYDLFMGGDPVGARLHAAQAAEAVPRSGLAQAELGRRLLSIDEHDGAATAFQLACDLGSADAETLRALGGAYMAKGHLAEAAGALRQALILDPASGSTWADLGCCLRDRGRTPAALRAARRAVRLMPSDGGARRALGTVLREGGALAEAATVLKVACVLDPANAGAWNALGSVLLERGGDLSAQRALVRASRLAPDDPALLSACLHARPLLPGQTTAHLNRVHRLWQTRFGAPEAPYPPRMVPAGRPLRLAVLWTYPDNHPATWFLWPLLRHRDETRLWVAILADHPADTESVQGATPTREAVRGSADAWVDVAGQPDAGLARVVRDLGVDVLLDVTGHGPGSRLPLFARQRPAPVQATWAFGAGSTGLHAMDLMITDAVRVPPDEDIHCTERVLRLPLGAVTFQPPPGLPAAAPPPANGRNTDVVLGTVAAPTQVGEPCLDLWASVMHSLPAARLDMLGPGWSDPEAADHLMAGLARHGIAADRVRIGEVTDGFGRRQALSRVSVVMDSWPTSCDLPILEAMAIGVPVVTWPGPSPRGRIAAAHLTHASHTDGLAESAEDFITRVRNAIHAPRVPVRWSPAAWTKGFTDALVRAVAVLAHEDYAAD